MSVVVTPAAVDDLRIAHRHYLSIGSDLADAFRSGFEQVVERLELFPLSGRPVEGLDDLRRAGMRRFPYGAFYRVRDGEEVRILRVLHERRDRGALLP